MIKEFLDFKDNMNMSNSSNDKVEIMRHSSRFVKRILYYTYNNFLQYNIKPKVLEKRKDLCNKSTKFSSIFNLLDSLNQRLITGHKAISEVNGFIAANPLYKDLLYLILERNLKLRVSTKLINKSIPDLIPTFNVALANKYDEKTKKKVDLEKDAWYVSRKLDGVRCLIVVDEKGKAKSYSRAGKQFHTLSLVEKEIESLGVKNVVFDGEMCIVNKDGDEDFQSIMKEIGRKDHTIENGLFQSFDYITYEDFSKGYSTEKLFSERFLALQDMLQDAVVNNSIKHISFLQQTPISNFRELDVLASESALNGWEGLMLRKNDLYKGKRSNDILKVKTFYDDEFTVESLNFGPFRYIKEGKEVEEEMLSAVTIKYKGNTVNVGSGFTIDQRKRFYSKPSEIHEKIITVQYFEESQNQNGEFSLRFPVVKVIHGDKRDT
jgi:DNA ligase-1